MSDLDSATMLAADFATLPDLIRAHARERGDKEALAAKDGALDYAALDRLMDRIAAALQRDGVAPGQAVAIVAGSGIEYGAVFLGTLRAGCVVAPIAPSATGEAIAAMIGDCGAPILFIDGDAAQTLKPFTLDMRVVRLDTDGFAAWLAPEDARPAAVTIAPEDGFNIIYSSGTTGTPKGIVQSHAMRWAHIHRNAGAGFGTAVTMLATPLYSNTTLVSFLPTLGGAARRC